MAFDDGYPGGYFIEAAVQAVVVMLRQQSLFGPGMDSRLTDAEADCKRTNMPDETICARAFFQLAVLARSRR